MNWRIFCDFDGTIAFEDVTDTLLERFASPAWRDIEQLWKAGKIGSRECLARQIPLLNMSRVELDHHLDTIAVDPEFPAFVAETRALGHHLIIVSDGLDYAIRRILARYGLDDLPVRANALEQHGACGWRLAFPHFDASCPVASGHCKCATVRRCHAAPTQHQRTLLIGDGTSDFCAAHQVDLVFAKHQLIRHCRSKGLLHHPIEGFAEARRLLGALQPLENQEHSDHA